MTHKLDCGCLMAIVPSGGGMMGWCPLHAAAPAMKKALREVQKIDRCTMAVDNLLIKLTFAPSPPTLLPCAHCGGTAGKVLLPDNWWKVICEGCGAGTRPNAYQSDAIERWNKRTPSPHICPDSCKYRANAECLRQHCKCTWCH